MCINSTRLGARCLRQIARPHDHPLAVRQVGGHGTEGNRHRIEIAPGEQVSLSFASAECAGKTDRAEFFFGKRRGFYLFKLDTNAEIA